MRLKAAFAPSFSRDLKRIRRRGLDEGELSNVIGLIIESTPESKEELRRRHRMHSLKGSWAAASATSQTLATGSSSGASTTGWRSSRGQGRTTKYSARPGQRVLIMPRTRKVLAIGA